MNFKRPHSYKLWPQRSVDHVCCIDPIVETVNVSAMTIRHSDLGRKEYIYKDERSFKNSKPDKTLHAVISDTDHSCNLQ